MPLTVVKASFYAIIRSPSTTSSFISKKNQQIPHLCVVAAPRCLLTFFDFTVNISLSL